MYILAINPGSTSTKIALYENEKEIIVKTFDHPMEEIDKYERIIDQLEMRKKVIYDFLNREDFDLNQLNATVGRGGMLPPSKAGAYIVNNIMVDRLKNRPLIEHASNLGGVLAYEIAKPLNIPAYIYDSVMVDELKDIARISGMPDIPRVSTSHVLNSRAMAIKLAKKIIQNWKM